jgi:acyl carrier protein
MPSRPPQTWMVWQSCKPSVRSHPKGKAEPVRPYNSIPHVNQQLHNTLRRELNVTVSQEEIIAGIAEIIEEVTGIEPSEITPEKSFVDDLDIDSLSMVEIAVQTEDKYGVKIPDEDLAGLRTVGDVVTYIQKLEEENPEAAQALRAKLETENPEAVESVRARLEADHQ